MVVLNHRRVDVGRMHRVEPDIVRRKLFGQAADQPDDTVLRGGVMRHSDQPPQGRDGTRQNDRTGAPADEMRSRCAARAPHRFHPRHRQQMPRSQRRRRVVNRRRLEFEHGAGDRTILVAQVTGLHSSDDRLPVLFYRGD
jgi:hypothetical protein